MTEQFYDQYEAAVQKGDRSCRCEEQEGACKRIGKPSGELVEEEPQAEEKQHPQEGYGSGVLVVYVVVQEEQCCNGEKGEW